ncbi:MAG: SAM-dependent methyltransferase [Sandaracinaceae bacterium]
MAGPRRRRHQDAYGRRARREGYAARSVYKLEEIDKKLRILRRGARVLDLGAFPGSWTTFAADKVQREGRVLGIDRTPFRGALPPHAEIREGDVMEIAAADLGGPASFDVVLSDMAPSTSGHRFTDQARSEALFLRALEIARSVLTDGGAFVGKIFQGGEFEAVRDQVRASFSTVRVIRPDATRRESYEVFLCGTGFRADTERAASGDDPE